MGRCIDCRGEFNRAIARDKLRCPDCTEEEARPEQPDPRDREGRTLRDQLAKLERPAKKRKR